MTAARPGASRSRRQLLRSLVLLAGVGLASACAPAATPPATPAPPPRPATVVPAVVASPSSLASPSPSPAAAPSPSPSPLARAPSPTPGRVGGQAVVALGGVPETLDPANAITIAAEAAGRPLYDGLVQFGPRFEPRPALAEQWTVLSGGQVYSFALRQGVRFQDGTPFNARAAAYNLERFLGEERPRRRELTFGILKSARADGEHRLELTLEQPWAELHQLAQYGAAMVSPDAHQTWKGDLGSHPVGSGPFRFVERTRGEQFIMERWDASWRGKPALDRVIFVPVPDDSARLLLLEAGEIQLAGSISVDLLPRVENNPLIASEAHPTGRAMGIAINTALPIFQDRRVRQALNYAIDKDAIVRTVYAGHATPLGGPVAPTIHGAASLQPYPYDPERARRLLTEAGFPLSQEQHLLGSRGRFPRDAALMEEIEKQLQAVGLKVRLELLDATQYSATITRAADETSLRLSLTSWLPTNGEIRGALYPLFHSSALMPRGQNTSLLKNAQVDELLDRASAATLSTERERLFVQAQERIREEAPWIFLVSPHLVIARSVRLHEPLVTPTEVVTVSEQTWIE